jgi:D-arabinose 5-phosphate isomerase GutQ
MSEDPVRLDHAQALALAREILIQEGDILHSLAEELGVPFWTTCQRIAGCPGLVWVTGVGTSAAVGLRFAHILTDCGVRSMFLPPDQGLHGHCGAMAPGEVLVAISRGGESVETNQMVEIANRRGLISIAMVHDEHSTTARQCRIVLPVHSPEEYEVGGYCATASSVAASAMCDAISAVVLKLTGYTLEAFRATHPGGAVGRNLAGGDPSGEGK